MISPKQKKILAFPYSSYDALICDGAIRSGKTSIMMVAFVDWAMREFNGQRFGVCGKTVGSATENIIKPYLMMAYSNKRYVMRWRRTDKLLEVRRGGVVNWFEVFGGKDEGSFALVQGRTLAGVLLDEVVLMPRSFVDQALARCSVNGARAWFSCNPGSPGHWFYNDWILRHEERNTLYLHFSMEDNPGLSQKTLARYKTMYEGIFYQRYILGEWVLAEGLVYPMFDRERHVLTEPAEVEGPYYVSSDYGVQNPNVFLLWGKEKGSSRWICLKEDYYSGRNENRQLTDGQLADRLENMLDGIVPKRIIIDPSAASMKAELRRRGYHLMDAKNDVLAGISNVCTLLGVDGLAFSGACRNTIDEFGAYIWDGAAADRGYDVPLKENDHAMDAVRYFVRTMRIVRKTIEKEVRRNEDLSRLA